MAWNQPEGAGAPPTMNVPDVPRSPALNEIAPDLSVAAGRVTHVRRAKGYP
jgi:hypothetical protein